MEFFINFLIWSILFHVITASICKGVQLILTRKITSSDAVLLKGRKETIIRNLKIVTKNCLIAAYLYAWFLCIAILSIKK